MKLEPRKRKIKVSQKQPECEIPVDSSSSEREKAPRKGRHAGRRKVRRNSQAEKESKRQRSVKVTLEEDSPREVCELVSPTQAPFPA